MVRVFFQNGNQTEVRTATKVVSGGVAGRATINCTDDSETVVAAFVLDQVVGYQIEDGQLSASSDSKVSAEGAL